VFLAVFFFWGKSLMLFKVCGKFLIGFIKNSRVIFFYESAYFSDFVGGTMARTTF